MEHLFDTSLSVRGKSVPYRVIFEAEIYKFQPEDGGAPGIEFTRAEDEWHSLSKTDEDLKKQALEQLDQYLLSQH